MSSSGIGRWSCLTAGKDLKGSVHNLFKDTILDLVWEALGKPRKNELKVTSDVAEIKTKDLSNLVGSSACHLLAIGINLWLTTSSIVGYSRILQHFMKPESSLPCSQEPSTGPYP
jgi:hypothetical protein